MGRVVGTGIEAFGPVWSALCTLNSCLKIDAIYYGDIFLMAAGAFDAAATGVNVWHAAAICDAADW